MSKQWEQIAFAIALAAFGWLLFQGQQQAKKQGSKTNIQGAFPQGSVPLFYSINQINASAALAPDAAGSVTITPLGSDSTGAIYPMDTLYPTTDYYGE